MNRRNFFTFLSTSAAAYAIPTRLPFEELKHFNCSNLFEEKKSAEVRLHGSEFEAYKQLSSKIKSVKSIVGYGHFNLIGFDEMLRVGKNYSKVGTFTPQEIALYESIFYESASKYGFYGEKVLANVTDEIKKSDTVKIPRTGHYLFKTDSVDMYEKIRKEVGHNIILTSGVRGITKQMDLFLTKIVRSYGNISIASRSLAPAGYSFHGIGDFDVGKVGFGYKNFTSEFAHTDEFKRLIDTGYVNIRYTKDNPFGVRYEPWHIKVT